MSKMRVIDLLNKIANGEEVPKKIKYDGQEYKITKILLEDNNYYFNYINEDMECIFPINTNCLNDEVEIIEEDKKIEKIEGEGDIFKIDTEMPIQSVVAWQKANNMIFKNKINEIIGEINNLKENK